MTDATATILAGIELLGRHRGVVEVRILKTHRGTVSGYFDNPDALAKAVEPWDGRASIYVTANPVMPELLARATNRLKELVQEATADAQILRRAWFLTDFDAVRPPGISATNAEVDAALERRNEALAFLQGHLWFSKPGLAMSGNGGHAIWLVDLPNDEQTTRLFERALKALSIMFSDNVVTVDEGVFNAARIWKLYGTIAVKGDATETRPHRRSAVERVPEELLLARAQLEDLAARAPGPRRTGRPASGGRESLDLVEAFTRKGWYLRALSGGKHAVTCPWTSVHSGDSGPAETCLFEPKAPGEPWGFDCKHAHCTDRTIRDVLDILGLRNVHQSPTPQPDTAEGWARAVSAREFCAATAADDTEWLDYPHLAKEVLSQWYAPRGTGKSVTAMEKAIAQARAGKRVLLLDRDNPPRSVKAGLRGLGGDTLDTLRVLTRSVAPPLTKTEKWAGFPFDQYDIIILDSIDSFTEGCGDRDSSRISLALAPLLDVVRRPNGPAVLMLGNVIKDGRAGRGSGVVEDRADIVFEVRDATGFHPSGKKPWWEELPPAGRGDWAAATTRRRGKDKPARIRVAFINSKFRVGEEPDPSVLEVDLAGDPWTVEDVTTAMVAEGDAAMAAALAERQRKLGDAARALVAEISRRETSGQAPFTSTVTEAWLEEKGLTDKDARALLRERDGQDWAIRPHPTDGRKKEVVSGSPETSTASTPPLSRIKTGDFTNQMWLGAWILINRIYPDATPVSMRVPNGGRCGQLIR